MAINQTCSLIRRLESIPRILRLYLHTDSINKMEVGTTTTFVHTSPCTFIRDVQTKLV